jgi:hypothetical protein
MAVATASTHRASSDAAFVPASKVARSGTSSPFSLRRNCRPAFLKAKILYGLVVQLKTGNVTVTISYKINIPYRSSKKVAPNRLQGIRLLLGAEQHESRRLDLEFIQRIYLFAAVHPGIILQFAGRGRKSRDLLQNMGAPLRFFQKKPPRTSRFQGLEC